MSKELEPQSLETLQAHQARLEKIIGQRQDLKEAIGTGRVKSGLPGIENLDNDLRIDSAKASVEASIERLQTRLASVDQTIESLTETDRLIETAQHYQDEVSIRRAQLEKLKESVSAGRLSQELLVLREREFQQLAARPGEDIQLNQGLELLRTHQQGTAQEAIVGPARKEEGKPPPEKEIATRISVNLLNNQVTVVDEETGDVREQWINPVDLTVLRRMAHNLGLPGLPAETLNEVARSAGGQGQRPLRNSINRLRRLVEQDPLNPRVITTTGHTAAARYQLNAGVELVGESKVAKERREATQVFEVSLPDGQVVSIRGKLRADALRTLIQVFEKGKSKEVSTKKLIRAVYSRYDKKLHSSLNKLIIGLRSNLEPFGWKIIQTVAHTGGWKSIQAKYRLEQVKKKEERRKAKTQREIPAVTSSRMEALDLFLSNPDVTAEDIIRVLGPSEKTDRYLTRPQAWFALRRATALLYARKKVRQATEEEMALWTRIKEGTGRESDKEAWETFKAGLDAWFMEDKKPYSEGEIAQIEKLEAEEVTPLTDEEAAILALALDKNRELLQKAGLEPLPKRVADKLYRKVKGRLRIDREKLQETRKGIFDKTEKLIETDAIYELIDLESPEAQELFNYLTSADSKRLLEFLRTWLSGENLDELFERFQQEGNGKTAQGQALAPTVEIQKGASAIEEPVPVVPEAKPEAETSVSPELAETDKSKVRTLSIEKLDPEVRNKIAAYLDRVEATNVQRFTPKQLVRFFDTLTRTVQKAMVEKSIVRPETGRDGLHPSYGTHDVAVMLYVNNSGNGFRKKQIKDLHRIVREEMEKRDKNKTQNSGK